MVLLQALRRNHRTLGSCPTCKTCTQRNSRSAILYYLFFAAQKETAENIVADILNKYRKEGVL
jgi:hypothetical protein